MNSRNQHKGSVKVDVKSDIYNTVGFAALGIHRLLNARKTQSYLSRGVNKSLTERSIQHHLSSWRNSKVQNYLAPGPSNSLTEKVVRPLFWMLSRHYEDRIPEVEAIAALGGGR